MAKILAVHGIAQQYTSAAQLRDLWLPALKGSFELAGKPPFVDNDLQVVFWGDLFRAPAQEFKGGDNLGVELEAPASSLEIELLIEMGKQAETLLDEPAELSKGAMTEFAQEQALRALSKLPGFEYLARRGAMDIALRGALRQVAAYLTDRPLREVILERFKKQIQPETLVVIGHSLGSVIAYEALCAGMGPNARLFVTLGSPLGMRGLIFDRLTPTPKFELGAWPGGVREWLNLAAKNDVVAMVKDLRPRFSNRVRNLLVDNGGEAHSAEFYLSNKEVGEAIAQSIL